MKLPKKSISSIFLVPTVINRESLKSHNFLNGYVKDIDKEVEYNMDVVYLLFKPGNMVRFADFLDNEYDTKDFIIEDYTYDDEYIIVVYKLDEKYKADFDLIKQGKYSKTSLEFQNLFPKVVKDGYGTKAIEGISTQYRIFTKAEDLRKHWEDKIAVEFKEFYEVWPTFEIEKETLDIKRVKEEYEGITG